MNQERLNQILQQESEEKQVLSLLLDRHLSRQDQLLVQKTQMGPTEGYIGSVSLEWLASRVRFAAQLPLFQQKYDHKTDNIIRDSQTVEELQQRPLDWSRQSHLAQYLAVMQNHKFPPVLVVITSGWVNDRYAEEWDGNFQATRTVADFTPLDQQNRLGLLNIGENFSIFVLDGQHRLMGIQGLMELLKTGKLEVYNKYKKPTGSVITLNDLIEEYGLNAGQLQQLGQEKIGIEIIPAVVQGETYEQARRRVRSIFVHVNRMAISLSKGQLVLLNEDDGFAIIARRIAISHPLFKERDDDDSNPRVNWDSATISSKSTVLTTLQALQDMVEGYLGYKFEHWKNKDKKNLITLRPDQDELDQGLEEMIKLFNYLANLPSYERLNYGYKTPELRRFSHEAEGGEANILFRPVGQIALLQALGFLVFRKDFLLKNLCEKLRQFDLEGGFDGIEHSRSIWYGVFYDPMKKRIQVSGRKLATQLLIYLLGGIDDDLERAQIRKALAEARTIKDAATNQEKTIDFKGKFVDPKKVGLPNLL
ncbi:DGQHR domain protein [Rippkaea orientalis PCC 8801]|uniref:DGQHR domain protein n=1 Tax=Rippkaea orientalis (strain PCC 8801 / RF-1) TaxID=41431 RepID=B7K2M3_RIPO1|nr:DGQHR domain-containing protein [Rippkaea orientalis]ACK66416.1 DGQHR domain protein [Rippkaea orientalis PCC 8801]